MILNEDVKAEIILTDGTIFNITSADICGSLSVSKQCVSGSGFELGAVCSAQLSLSVRISGVNRYKMIGGTVNLKLFKCSKWNNAGVYNITSASRHRDIITISASDNLILMDKSASSEGENSHKLNQIAEYLKSRKTIYQTLKYIVEDISGLELAQTQTEIESMPNGECDTIVFQDIQTDCPRDWLSWCSEFLSGFAYADENGRIAIKQFENSSSETVYQSEIQADTCDIADFEIKIARVGITAFDGGWGYYYDPENDGKPNTIYIDLSDNLIAQGKNYIWLYSMDVLERIYQNVIRIPYRPFNMTVHSDKIFNLGECISIEDYDGNFYNSVITHITYTLNGGYQLKCAGEDTRLLADTKSRTTLKRESEKLQAKIIEAKGKDLTQEELNQLETDSKLIEGMTYYIIE